MPRSSWPTVWVATALTLAAAVAAPAQQTARYLSARDVLTKPQPDPDFEIAYGSDPNQVGHLRIPDSPGPHPVLIVIHGGCWLSFADLKHLGEFSQDLTDQGVATWSVEYRRVDSPGGGWPNTFLDLAAGIDHLRALAEPNNLDLRRVVVTGHSAGGHLALWAAARPRIPASSPLHVPDPLAVGGVVSLAGPGDLMAFRPLDNQVCGGDVIDRLVGGTPEQVPARYAAASPKEMLPLGVPQRLLTGAADRAVPFQFANDYAALARAAGDDVIAVTLDDAAHFEVVQPGTTAWPAVRETILEMFGRLAAAR